MAGARLTLARATGPPSKREADLLADASMRLVELTASRLDDVYIKSALPSTMESSFWPHLPSESASHHIRFLTVSKSLHLVEAPSFV